MVESNATLNILSELQEPYQQLQKRNRKSVNAKLAQLWAQKEKEIRAKQLE